MLRPIMPHEFDECAARAYELALDLSRSFYPTYADGIKTREEFLAGAREGLKQENEQILLYVEDGEFAGWIHFRWLAEDKYLDFMSFNISGSISRAIDEFTDYAATWFKGYTVYFGMSAENTEATAYLEKCGLPCTEHSEHYVLHFKDYECLPEPEGIVPVTFKNYGDFKKLHDGEDMYWNSERLYEAMLGRRAHPWYIYLLYRDGEPKGAVYFNYNSGMMTIYGVDYTNGFDADIMRPLMITALNKAKRDGLRHLCYFAEEGEDAVLRPLPFERIGEYRLYLRQL